MKRQPLVAMIAGLVMIAGSAACSGAEATSVSRDRRAQGVDVIEREKLGGPAALVLEATRDNVQLSEVQARALEDVAIDLDDESDRLVALRDELRASAVTVVRAGTGDAETFDRTIADVVSDVEEHVAATTDALEEIHGVLDDDQRLVVADALRARLDERFGARTKPQEPTRDGFRRLASYLVLSPKQVDELLALKKELVGEKRDLRPTQAELYGLVDAFEGEGFGDALDAFREGKAKILRVRLARAGQRTDAMLAILTPAQRDLLADLILEGPGKVLLGSSAE